MHQHHGARICSQMLRCRSCDAPMGGYRDGGERVVMTKCARCGSLLQRDVGWSGYDFYPRPIL